MAKLKLTGKQLRAIGYPEGPVISIAMNVMQKNYKHDKKENVMELLQKVLAAPVEYENDAVLGLIAEKLTPKKETEGAEISLNQSGIPSSAVQPSYDGEQETTQAGVPIVGINGQNISAEAASEAFDEILTKAQVLAIVDPFIV